MNYEKIPAPAYVLDEKLLRKNLELMQYVQAESGAHIILALKGFSMWSVFPMVGKYLKGATASSLNEARLIFEEMGKKAHTYSPAYAPSEFQEIMQYSSHLTFNTISQYERFRVQAATNPDKISCGIRVNPEWSDVATDLYNPAAPGSRLGEVDENFTNGLPEGIEGLHCHTLCESSAESTGNLIRVFEEKFGHFIPKLKWVNFGGGHLMTKKGYNIPHLIQVLKNFREKWGVEVILEPGSAVAWETGVLIASVLDIVENRGVTTALLDVSFTAHMPDCLEMPYRPRITGATDPIEGKPTYRIGGSSCLSGDFMLEYSFEKPLVVGQKIIFEDMIHYTMVKTSMFNGVVHPNIAIWTEKNRLKTVRKFKYADYKNRLS